MNVTAEQINLLQVLASVYADGCRSEFLAVRDRDGMELVYHDHANIRTAAENSDLEQLASQGLISLGTTSRGSLRGKITALGLEAAAPPTGPRTGEAVRGVRVFIGHGRSAAWRELKDFLVDRLHLEYEEFNRTPAAGYSTKEVLERMLDDAAVAFIVMTAEDEQPDGTFRARENVVHEAGLFQGRLGFSRAILLLEDGCQQFSNVGGLTHIAFPRGSISACFESIRAVIERERAAFPSSLKQATGRASALPASTVEDRRRSVYGLAVRVLRDLAGQAVSVGGAAIFLPGGLWYAHDPLWERTARRIGEFDRNGRFRPFVEPAAFDGSDGGLAEAARGILELYVWGSEHFADFDRVRSEHQLPEKAVVERALLQHAEGAS